MSGDIRHIDENDFLALAVEGPQLPTGVYGGDEFVFGAVSDVRHFFEGLEPRVIRLLWYLTITAVISRKSPLTGTLVFLSMLNSLMKVSRIQE